VAAPGSPPGLLGSGVEREDRARDAALHRAQHATG
jgi:hypothetical protein